jgi:hypothetical protein
MTSAGAPKSALIYPGWRLFQPDRARCHSKDRKATDRSLDLRRRVGISQEGFVVTVPQRCRRVVSAGESAGVGATHAALIPPPQEHAAAMSAWAGEPQVRAHILDLYTYRQERSSGKELAGVPAR